MKGMHGVQEWQSLVDLLFFFSLFLLVELIYSLDISAGLDAQQAQEILKGSLNIIPIFLNQLIKLS